MRVKCFERTYSNDLEENVNQFLEKLDEAGLEVDTIIPLFLSGHSVNEFGCMVLYDRENRIKQIVTKEEQNGAEL